MLFKIGYRLKYFNVKNIVVCYDTRCSNQTLLFSLASGMMANGINVIDGMVLPTSAIAYYTYIKKMVGVVITASHNNFLYNGIKIFKNGEKISYLDEQRLEALLDEPLQFNDDIEYGRYSKSFEPFELYKKYLSSFIVKNNLCLAFDFAEGALSNIGPQILNRMNSKNIYIGNHPNGYNINDTGSTNLQNLINTLKTNNLPYGFAFDGDGDRVIMVDQSGYIYSGDDLLFIIVHYFEKYQLLKNHKVVLSKNANLGTINHFKKNGFDVVLSDIGDKNLLLTMNTIASSFGAEPSGHLILKDLMPTGDGLLASIILANIISADPLFDYKINKYPVIETNYSADFETINKVLNNEEILNFINDYLNTYPDTGKLIIRKSGTENLLRLLISNQDDNLLKHHYLLIDHLIKKIVDIKE